MAELRIANWNIEWMNRWFTPDRTQAEWRPDDEIKGVSDIADLSRRVAQAIEAMAPDVLLIQEGPSRAAEMALFVGDRLGGRYEIAGPVGDGEQKLYALVLKGSAVVADVAVIGARDDFDFADAFDVDIQGIHVPEPYRMTRPPLLLDLTLANGRRIEIVNIHAKSKYVHNGRELWDNPATRPEFVRKAVLARRRISAEAMRIRTYVNTRFAADPEVALVVAGDFNDGPGLDYFETLYLTHNLADLIAGSPYDPQRMLRHAFVDVVDREDNFTAEFFDFIAGKTTRPLLDHIFLSPALFWNASGERAATGAIEHEMWRQASDEARPGGRERHPSDHRPTTAVIAL